MHWGALLSSGKPWEAVGSPLGGSRRLWDALGCLGEVWGAPEKFGRLWDALGGLGKIWEALGSSGSLLDMYQKLKEIDHEIHRGLIVYIPFQISIKGLRK